MIPFYASLIANAMEFSRIDVTTQVDRLQAEGL